MVGSNLFEVVLPLITRGNSLGVSHPPTLRRGKYCVNLRHPTDVGFPEKYKSEVTPGRGGKAWRHSTVSPREGFTAVSASAAQ